MISSVVYTTPDNNSSTFTAAYNAHSSVKNEQELRNAINVALGEAPTQYVIALTKDITLTGSSLTIPAKANVVLINDGNTPRKLIGPNGTSTIHVAGGATLVLDGITVTHNKDDRGRGVYVNASATLILNSGEITENNIYSGGIISDAQCGGGVYNWGTFTMNGGTISKNSAYNGGGVYSIITFEMNAGEVSENTAAGAGGGADNLGTFTMNGGTFYKNKGTVCGGVFNGVYAKFTLTDGKFLENMATNGCGGGVYNDGYGTFIMIGGTFSKNKAYDGGGVYNLGIFKMSGGTIGGASATESNIATDNGGGVCNGGYFSDFNLIGGIISNNIATSGGGVEITAGVFNMLGGEISDNTAYWGGGVLVGDSTIFDMEGGVLFGNTANYYGGGVYNWWGTFTMSGDATISNNKTPYDGGGVYNQRYFVMSGNAVIANNTANGNGGGVYNSATCNMFDNAVISNNTASFGGGVHLDQGQLTLADNAAITNNIAINFGGGIQNTDQGRITLSDNTAIANNSANYGGGIFTTSTNTKAVTINGGQISNNSARYSGGGAYTYSKFILTSGAIANNTAGVDGGGVFIATGFVELHTGTISGNIAGNNGGGIWITNTEDITYLQMLYIENTVIFKNNKAKIQVALTKLNTYEEEIYRNQIKITDGAWSNGECYGINNYDISYTASYTISYAPGTQGTWQAIDETYTGLAFGASTPVFGTNSGADTAVDHTAGWIFTGWQPTWSSTAAGNITYVAQWTKTVQPIFYTLTYNGNGYTSGTVPLGGFYPAGYSVLIVNQGNMAREGYTFQGWAYNSDAKTPDFATGSTAYHTLTKDVTLYAVWATEKTPPQTKYTVTYQPGTYGNFDPVSFVCALGELTPKAPDVTGQPGWRFIGWAPEPTPTVEGDAAYVAQWEPKMFTVKFVDWDGTVLKTETVPYGGNATAPANPSRNGYTFIGWNPATFTNITSDLTITAQYTQNNGGGSGGNNGGSGGNGGNGGGSQTNKPTNTPPPTTTPPLPNTTPVPNGTKEEPIQTWALVNLILSIAGLILAIAIGICVLLQHKKKQKK
ncbi:InlB B-repeat-containing protein, partial [Candidatus Bathycorpusculum sp.]|uniref:InlB B-repeat-containing protein n=1 Tax=Candidatus Bathycorpusculum sp. TaxID=2994959 RepID=UPI00282FFFAA|nr:InlB B-repeat-containing protein [Candidatus Termitimicrobium sp.]MCL2686547.1 InlB B-repeat-containing protein [Candidatus Termitimicrobium sp.]